jgi:hypothetical protein
VPVDVHPAVGQAPNAAHPEEFDRLPEQGGQFSTPVNACKTGNNHDRLLSKNEVPGFAKPGSTAQSLQQSGSRGKEITAAGDAHTVSFLL